MSEAKLLGGIEAGGTKFVCAVGYGAEPGGIVERVRIETGEPGETLAAVGDFFRRMEERHGELAAMGVGTFGPAGVNPAAASYGHILTTPKLGWKGFDFVGALRAAFEVPVRFETDVNAALLGEARHGVARGIENVAYVTVGTGIGGGFLCGGKLLHGRMHPEVGHLVVPELDAEQESVCPFHECCLEGRASGPAMEKRWGKPAAELPADHAAWALEAEYLAQGMMSLTAAWSPDRIILGGGVLQQEGLIGRVRERFGEIAGGYWEGLPLLDEYLVLPGLGQDAGIVGAMVLAGESSKGILPVDE